MFHCGFALLVLKTVVSIFLVVKKWVEGATSVTSLPVRNHSSILSAHERDPILVVTILKIVVSSVLIVDLAVKNSSQLKKLFNHVLPPPS